MKIKGCFRRSSLVLTLIFGGGLLSSVPSVAAKDPLTPEKEAARLGRILKPISDDTWQTVAGPRISEKYSVVKGDTLFDISKKLFGDPKYWPKIWALNNDTISNPHWLKPGYVIAFSPGSGSSLPSLSLKDQAANVEKTTDAPAPLVVSSKRSQEWKDLPQQPWEIFKITLPPEVDPLGFDRSARQKIIYKGGFEPFVFPATEQIPVLGQIVGGRNEAQFFTLHDLVYIQADEKLQVGETYSLTGPPVLLKSKKSDRVGYSYLALGKVKIVGVRDHLFLGKIVSTRDFTPRGSFVIAERPKLPELTPIAGPRPIPGLLLIDHNGSIFTTTQHKEALVDRGSDDGVQPGMIFRAYQHRDPANNKRITNGNFVIMGDFMVTQVSPTFCSVVALQTISTINEESPVVLLTDISDLQNSSGFSEKTADDDELDKLDENDGLSAAERRELKQLERWKKNPTPSPSASPTPSPSISPSPEPTPTDTPSPTPSDTPTPAPSSAEPTSEPTPAVTNEPAPSATSATPDSASSSPSLSSPGTETPPIAEPTPALPSAPETAPPTVPTTNPAPESGTTAPVSN
ncbi:MAG: LysM peptidoglycan-binding domain-containing protein [Bdellovibrio sp.]|nr:LysM peptidoglycan-binding domain-containing protein [Bdellovibrio sp.]